MKLATWIFPESSGTIPGIPGLFPGGSKVVIDEETNTVYSFGPINDTALKVDATVKITPKSEQEITTPGYNKDKK